MNLHAIAGPLVAAVNPTVQATVKVSTGTTEAPDGTLTPTYATPVTVPAQIQALTFKDLMQLQGINMNGTRRAIYFYGVVEGINRAENKGGDIVTFPDGSVWLVAQVLESWGASAGVVGEEWVKVAVTQQQG